MNETMGFSTICARDSAHLTEGNLKPTVPPIYMTTSFLFDSAEDGATKCQDYENGFAYSRDCNPTNMYLAKKIAELEQGESAMVFGSGVGAISAVLFMLTKSGDHCIADHTLYSASHYLLDTTLPNYGVDVQFVDTSNLSELENAIRDNTKFIYLETPANPTMKVVDLPAIAQIAKKHHVTTIVDSTFATPYLQRPLTMGIDVVLHSTTKYLCGHGDALGGVVVSNNKFIHELNLSSLQNIGAVASPFNSWLTLRGIKTLRVRMDWMCRSAMQIAKWLESHPKVSTVHYPGLESDPYHELASHIMDDYGAMISFELKGGLEAGRAMMNAVKLCGLAVSLGHADTIIQHPASMTHWYTSKKDREASGITDGLVRLSVGLEDPEDIINDLEQAMSAI